MLLRLSPEQPLQASMVGAFLDMRTGYPTQHAVELMAIKNGLKARSRFNDGDANEYELMSKMPMTI